MPNQAIDLEVQKYNPANTIVYKIVSASGGDKSPAIWRADVGTTAGQKPSFSIVSRSNGTNTGRRVDVKFAYPSTVTGTDGITRVTDTFVWTLSALVPLGMTDANVQEAAAQGAHLMNQGNVIATLISGFAPV